jgi:hypothetical protein
MKKKILIGFIALIVLVLGSAVLLPIVFKDKIITKIKTEANNNLNATLDFTGFDLTLFKSFPDFTLDLQGFSIVGKGEFEDETFTHIKSLRLNIDLLSVVKGSQFEIKGIVVDNPYINAKILKSGKANWDIALPSDETTPEAASEEASEFKAALKHYEVINGHVIYDDQEGDIYAELTGLNHTGKGDFTQDNFILETLTTIDQLTCKMDGIKYLSKVNTEVKADLDMDMKNFKFTFKDNEARLNNLYLGMDGFIAMPGDDIDMELTYYAKKTEFKNILSLVPAVYATDFESVQASGTLALDGYVKGRFNDNSLPGFGLKLLIENGMFSYPDLPKSVKNVFVNLKVDNHSGNPDHTIVDLKRFYMEMADNPFEMKMKVTSPESDPNIDGEIKGKLILNTIKDIIPLDEGESVTGTIVADVSMKGRMSSIEKEQYDQFEMKGTLMAVDIDYKSKETPYDLSIAKIYLNFSPRSVDLTAFESKIGKSDMSADGYIANFLGYAFKDEALTGTFNFRSNFMDLNEFMTEEENTGTTASSTEEAPLSVIEVPANVNFVLNSSIKKMIYDNIEIENMTGAIKVNDQTVRMDNVRMNMLDGSMVMNGSYNTKDITKPGFSFDMDILNFDIQKSAKTFVTLETLAPVAKNAYGKYSVKIGINGELDGQMDPVMNSLNGQGKLATTSVVIQNFEPITKMADALKMEQYKKLVLNDVNIAFEFKDGRVVVEPFDMKLGNASARVHGSTYFDQTIDYTWNLDIPRSEFGGAANAVLTGLVSQAQTKGANINLGEMINVDVLIGGTVMNPVIKTNLKDKAAGVVSDLKDKAKEEIIKKVEEVKEKAKEEVDKKVDEAKAKASAEAEKIIRDAELKANTIRSEAKNLAETTRKEANTNAKKIEDEAKNPVAKVAAKAAADKVRNEGEAKAKKIESEGDSKAQAVIDEARKQADKLK